MTKPLMAQSNSKVFSVPKASFTTDRGNLNLQHTNIIPL